VARNTIRTTASPDAVFAVLDDACAYPRWVVGARRIRAVDASWPAVGSKFHHALGTEGAELHDSSKVIDRDPPRHLLLEVRFRPTGVAKVDIRVDGDAGGSVVAMEEIPTGGALSHVPNAIVDPLLTIRNAVSLRRLRREVEAR
jgi:hypothetical protein